MYNLEYKIVLINLDKDKDRLDFMTKQLNNLGLEFDRFSAINGGEYLDKYKYFYNKDLSIKLYGTSLTEGEIGCALSHNKCYEKFLNDEEYKNIKYFLILEDDVILDKNFKNILEKEIEKNEKNYKWDYLQFNYYPINTFSIVMNTFFKKFIWNYRIFMRTKNLKYKFIYFFKIFIYPFLSLFTDLRVYMLSKYFKGIHKTFPKNPMLTGAYLINKDITKDLFEISKEITYPADVITSEKIFKFKQYKFYFYTPAIARQRDDIKSSIDIMEKRV